MKFQDKHEHDLVFALTDKVFKEMQSRAPNMSFDKWQVQRTIAVLVLLSREDKDALLNLLELCRVQVNQGTMVGDELTIE